MPSTTDVLRLYKNLLLSAAKFDNYNFREYLLRKVKDSFHVNKNLSGDAATAAYNDGINNLAVLKRQLKISQMYTFEKVVVEPLEKHA